MTDSEKAKMIRGDHYNASDSVLRADRLHAREVMHRLNVTAPRGHLSSYADIVAELLPNATRPTWLQPPFYCDYGYNLYIGEDVFINFNCVFLDCAPIAIGAYCQFGPGVQLYTASHPISAKSRRAAVEFAKPITIGEDCWIGGAVVVCPGITIGNRCVIGAGAVVTQDIPDDSVAVGNPARVIRTLE
jgi:maltose O-acetyltransferase